MSGKLIVIDGLDGSGKHTQAQLLEDRMRRAGLPVKAVSFPDYAQPSSALVRAYLAGEFGGADEVNAYAASSFCAVDRYASYRKFWQRDYQAGGVILAESERDAELPERVGSLARTKQYFYGKIMVSRYEREGQV